MRVVFSRPLRSSAAWLLLAAGLMLGASAGAAVPPGVPDCACEAREALRAQRDRLADASSVEAARERALGDVAAARRALGVATWLAPSSSSLREARDRLADYARDVERARSPEEVADHFADFMQVADGADVVGVDGYYDGGDNRCSFTDREIIAIVLGLILGIIPGLILLVLLC